MSKPTPTQKEGKSKKRKHVNKGRITDFKYDVYVYKVLKQVHPDTGISGAALATMVNLVKVNVMKIVKSTNPFMAMSGNKTITSREIQSGVRLSLPGELAKHAVSEGTKAVTKFNASVTYPGDVNPNPKKKGEKKKPERRGHRAGLTFNVTKLEKLMMMESNAERKGAGAAVYLAGVCEYLCAEVLELAGNAARDNQRVRVTPRHIKLAIANDEELHKLYRDVIIGGGVIPRIHEKLIPVHHEPKHKRSPSKSPSKKKTTHKKKKMTKRKTK